MSSSAVEIVLPTATGVTVDEETLTVELSDGRSISAPLAWFPRLVHASRKERSTWRFIGRGDGIHWPDLDEDISVEGLIAGQPSGESQRSLTKWLRSRKAARTRRRPTGRSALPAAAKTLKKR